MLLPDKELAKFLIDTGLVSKADVAKAEADKNISGVSLAETLVSLGKVTEADMRKAKAYVLGVPFVDLKGLRIEPEVLSLIPEPVARRHNIVSFRRDNNKGLEVAMLDIEDLEAIDFIKKHVGGKIIPRLTDTESIRQVLLQYQKSLKAEFGDLIKKELVNIERQSPKLSEEDSASELKKLAEDLPVVRIVDSLLSHAVLGRASDVHIEPFENELLIRYRIDGLLHDAMVLPKTAASAISARIKVMANLRLDEKRLPQDGRFKTETADQKVSLRVSVLPTYFGEKIVIRLLPDSARGLSLEEAGFHGLALEKIHQSIRQTSGLILATGPTGSGKTTTLYSLLQMLNTPEVNISTIEDPIEYQVPRVNQTQVKPEIGLTFGNGLRSLVRQDPDIIMVGEIRDGETVALAINAALTGHLVLSTLHTNSAAGAIPRLVDMGAEPFLLVSTLNIVIAQRLVRRLCRGAEKYHLPKAEIDKLKRIVRLDEILKLLHEENIIPREITSWEEISFWKPTLSSECEDGYSGRVGIYEVLTVSLAVKEMIIAGKTADDIEVEAKKEGMVSMLEDGVYKAVQGLTTIEEVLRVVSE